jgi:predicted component of type VI protein secretion system
MANGAFTTFGAGDIINSIDSTITLCLSGNEPRLTEVYTSSVQNSSNSGQYYIHVYQTSSTETTAANDKA